MKCANEECLCPTVGNSKYCRTHRDDAREAWLQKIEESKREREDRYARFERAYHEACKRGSAALEACVPVPMVVQQRASVMDDSSPVVQEWHVPDGVCGFAWVKVYPGNCSFANWLKKTGKVRSERSYGGGVSIWISAGGQSMQKKEKYAQAFAECLREMLPELKGKVYADSRMD